jgi:hypothetical protein
MAIRRRSFLSGFAGSAVAGALETAARGATPATPLPSVKLGKATITRLILSGNPVGGISHATSKLDELMRQYFTVERTADLLLHAEEQGITTFQSHYSPLVRDGLNLARERGSNIQWICLGQINDQGFIKDVLALKPIAIAHHGTSTDFAFHYGYPAPRIIQDYIKRIHDMGVLAGVSLHCPRYLPRIEDLGWENDFYMTSLYYITRTTAELKQIYGDTLVQRDEPFAHGDPARMCEQIRATKKPCLAFKLLAAGRVCWSRQSIDTAFQFAYRNIKPGDAAIVGMFPILTDEVSENANLARKYAFPIAM